MSRGQHKTSATLLRRARDWADDQAWLEMFRRYDPLLERWSQKYLASPADVAEVNQRVWIELAERIILFRYDPAKSFRAWLKTLHRSRLQDFLKAQVREALRHESACRQVALMRAVEATTTTTTGDEPGQQGRVEQIQARMMQIQESVRKRVKEQTWQIFWSIAIEQRGVGETAKEFEMTYTATFAAFRRVEKLLRDEAMKGKPQP